LFNISRNTIGLWLKRQAETGDFQALPNKPNGNGHKITDWEKFRNASVISWRQNERWKWRNFGMEKLAIAPSHEPDGVTTRLKPLWAKR